MHSDTETLIEEVLTEICERWGRSFSPSLHNKTAGAVVEDIATLLINELDLPYDNREFIALYQHLTVDKCSDIDFMPGNANVRILGVVKLIVIPILRR